MPPTCDVDDCTNDVDTKDPGGWWRDKCWACITEAAERDLSNNPYHNDDTI